MTRPWRLAICGLASESCTFSPLTTTLADIRVQRGAALLARHAYAASLPDAECVPLLRAYALPGGPWAADAYDSLLGELLDMLRAGGPWDGVLLDLHGALYVHGREDVEAHLIAAVRAVAGPAALLAASYDLHGNVSLQVLAELDILTAYRTAPHVDEAETRERAARLLLRALRGGVRPAKALVQLPLTLPGERAMTTVDPARALYARLPATIGGGIWDASLLLGYAWADEPRVGAATVAFGDAAVAVEAAALELANAWWDARDAYQFGQETGTVDECIARAMQHDAAPVFISDAGDNVTGGGVGDVPAVLESLLAHGAHDALYASLADASAVAACQAAGVGGAVALALGGKLDPLHGSPLDVQARVIGLVETSWGGDAAVVQTDRVRAAVTIVVTTQRCAFTTVQQFHDLGLDPRAYRIVVVKLGYLFDELQPLATRSLLAFSPGCINADITQLPYQRLRRPIYPLDQAMQWTPEATVWPARQTMPPA